MWIFTMDGLGLLYLCAICISAVQSQPQDVNTLLRQRQGFPAQVERSFFDPANDPRRFGAPDGGMFTIDRHLEVPQNAIRRGHSSFQMGGSRQSRTESTQIGQFNAAGIHPGMTGAMDHGGQTGVATQGQMEASRQAELGASGQTEVTVEGEALVPTRLLAGGQSGVVAAGNQMALASSGQDMFGSAGQAATIDNVNRQLNQGQLEASSQTELAAGGQGEVSVEGEVAVPTQVLEAAQRVQGGIGTGVNAGAVGTQTGDITGTQAMDMSLARRGEMTGVGAVSGVGTSGVSGSGEVSAEFSGSRAGQITGEISREGQLGAQTGDFGGIQQGELSGTRTGQITGEISREGQLGLQTGGQIDQALVGQGDQSGLAAGGAVAMSNQADVRAGGQGEVTIEGEVAVPTQMLDRTGGTFIQGSGGLTGSRDVAGAQQFETTRQGMTGVQDITGIQDQGRTLGGRTLDFSGIGMSREGQFSGSRDARLGLSGETTITGPRGGQIETSRRAGLGISGDAQFDATRDSRIGIGQSGDLSASRDRDLGLGVSRDTTITGPRGGQIETSRRAGLGISRDSQLEASRDQQLGSGQTGSLTGSRERDLRLGLSRDTTITGPRGGQIEASRRTGLGVSRDSQIDMSGGRDQSLGPIVGSGMREGQMTASNQVDMSAGGQGEITMEGEIPVPKQFAGSAGQMFDRGSRRDGVDFVGSGQTGSFSGSRDRDLRLGLSRDTTITGSRGGQIETSRRAGLGLSTEAQLDASRDRQLGTGQTGSLTGSRDRDLRLGLSRDTTITGPRGGQIETSRNAGLGLSSDAQVDASRDRQFGTGQSGSLSGSRDQDLRLGTSRDTTITGPHGGQIETSRNTGLGLSRDSQFDVSRGRDLSTGQLPAGGMREGQLSASNQVDVSAGGQGEVTVEGEIAVPRQFAGAAGQGLGGGSRQDRVDFGGRRRLDLSGSGQTDVAGQFDRRTDLTGQQTLDGLAGRNIDLTALGRSDQGLSTSASGSIDLSGRGEQTTRRSGSGQTDWFRTRNMGRRMGKGRAFQISHVSVNVRCYADPLKGLSCGVEYPDDQCKEKWDFPNPCTRENMDMNITKFVHPYDNSKFLMCGEMGKLYIVQCPRLEIFHAGCGQCVDENVGLTASCEEPLPPQTSNPCTRQNIIDNKLFFGFPRNISKFIHCDVWGKPWVRDCTRGEVWDQWQVACVNPSLINPCSRPNADLAFLYPHPCDPKRYLRCDLKGDAYEEICGYNEAFNVATQYCDPVGSFYGSDDPPYCADYIFGFKNHRNYEDPRLRQGGSQSGTDFGIGQASTRNRGPERTDLGQGINGKPVSTNEGVTNLAGTITIHRSKLRTYTYRKGEQYAEPCITDNIKEGRYHFRVTGDPHSFIQCDDHGFAHIIACPAARGGRRDYFDPWTNTCVDGAVHVDNLISR